MVHGPWCTVHGARCTHLACATYSRLCFAQYLATSDEDAATFLGLPRAEQAARVWQGLFVDRSPLSEARRGVITVLQKLGLEELLRQARAAPQALTSAAPNPSPSP